jgi:hypothetical protein
MGYENIGPFIYAGIALKLPNGNYGLVLVMDHYDSDLSTYLKDHPQDNDAYVKAFMIIKDLILKYNRFCLDIKPHNFVIRELPDGDTDVRMIDFDSLFCSAKYYDRYIPAFFVIMIIQFLLLVFNRNMGVLEHMIDYFRSTIYSPLNDHYAPEIYELLKNDPWLADSFGRNYRGFNIPFVDFRKMIQDTHSTVISKDLSLGEYIELLKSLDTIQNDLFYLGPDMDDLDTIVIEPEQKPDDKDIKDPNKKKNFLRTFTSGKYIPSEIYYPYGHYYSPDIVNSNKRSIKKRFNSRRHGSKKKIHS